MKLKSSGKKEEIKGCGINYEFQQWKQEKNNLKKLSMTWLAYQMDETLLFMNEISCK
jgi:hypothetical protein